MPIHTLIRAPGLSEPISHYADAVRAGDTIYVSGQASVDAQGNLVGAGDVVVQTRQVVENMKLALAAAGATLDDVVKVSVYLATVADRAKVNEVRKAYFGANRPASTLIGISEFAIPGMLIEIEAIAVVSQGQQAGRGGVVRRRARARQGASRRSIRSGLAAGRAHRGSGDRRPPRSGAGPART